MAVGRRAGKTQWGSGETIKAAADGKRAWWLAPSYAQAGEGWDVMTWIAGQLPGTTIRESDRKILFPSGGSVQVKTADDPNRLRGAGLDLAVLDEAAFMKSGVWSRVIRPALADKRGRAIFISTPRGKNWFYDLFILGLEGRNDWKSFQFPSSVNPMLDEAEILAGVESSGGPGAVAAREEWFAEFLDESGVFRRVREASTGSIEQPVPGAEYCGFFDLGFHDFNAGAFFRCDGEYGAHPVEVFAERWHRADWPLTKTRIIETAKRYPGSLAIDATKETFRNNLSNELKAALPRSRVFPVDFKRPNKEAAILNFAAALEGSRVTLLHPESCEAASAQLRELSEYQQERTPLGNVRYNAPSGRNDDLAVAAFTAFQMISERMQSPHDMIRRVSGGSWF